MTSSILIGMDFMVPNCISIHAGDMLISSLQGTARFMEKPSPIKKSTNARYGVYTASPFLPELSYLSRDS